MGHKICDVMLVDEIHSFHNLTHGIREILKIHRCLNLMFLKGEIIKNY